MRTLTKLFLFFLVAGLGLAFIPAVRAANTPGKIFDLTNIKAGRDFSPYGTSYNKGINGAIGDVNGDGRDEIVTITGAATSGHLRVFDLNGNPLSWNVFPFEKAYTGGGKIAVGDTDADGQKEIIVVPAGARLPEVFIFKYGKNAPVKKYQVFQPGFRGGLSVTSGDIDYDGKDEVIVATASRGGNVAVYGGDGKFWGLSIFPFGQAYKGGLSVAYGAFREGQPGLAVGTLAGANGRVKVISAEKNFKVWGDFYPFGRSFKSGTNVAAADVNKDTISEVVTAVASGGAPHVLAYSTTGKIQNAVNFFPFDKSESGGVNLAATNEKLAVWPAKVVAATDYSFCRTHRCVALTFDDGGSRGGSLENILAALDKHNVKATFFLIGRWMDGNRNTVADISRRGHRLGNHTWNHSICTRIPAEQIRSELQKADSLVSLITGKPTKPHFRYPGGGHNASTDAVVMGEGYHYWQWTADTRDAMGNHDPASIKNIALSGLRPGSVILFHTGNPATGAAMDGIISAIKAQGYEIVTLDQMEWQKGSQW